MKRLTIALAAVAALALAPAAVASGSLSGKYKTVIKGSHQLGGGLNGTWVLNFTKGQYHVTDNGMAAVHGKTVIKGNVITFRDEKGSNGCPTAGKYRFKLNGKKLTFKRISDSTSSNCLGRTLVLARTFTKV